MTKLPDTHSDEAMQRRPSRRQLVRAIRDAIWRMNHRQDMEGVMVEIRQGLLDQDVPVLFCAVNLLDRSVSPPVVVAHSMNPSGEWRRLETGAKTIIRFCDAGEVVYRRDLSLDDPYSEANYMGEVRCVVDVPFAQGTLAVNSLLPNAFSDELIDMLQELAGLLEDGFRRLEEIQRVEVRLQVRENVWQMGTTQDIEEVIVALREGFDELNFHYSSCGLNLVYLHHVEQDEHVVMSHNMTRGADWLTLGRQPQPLIVKFWRDGQPAYRRDLDAQDIYNEQSTISEYYGKRPRSVIDIPFSHGTLALNSTEPNAFSDDQVALLLDLATVLEEGFRRRDDLKALEERTAHLATEVEERRQVEQTLEKSLEEKEVLLREVHHRVKNNLQVVCSLLNLRADGLRDEQAVNSFTDTRAQIESMALIHELLYEAENLSEIEGGSFLKDLCEGVFASYGVDGNRIRLEVEVGPKALSVDVAIESGLIVHELVSNSLKHAFPGGREGVIQVQVARDEHEIRLSVRDNGVGLPDPLPSEGSIGLLLVHDLAGKLRGTVSMDSDEGASFTVSIPTHRD